MPRDVKTCVRWLSIVAMVIIVLRLLSGCVRPETALTPVVEIGESWPFCLPNQPCVLAMTTCTLDNHPIVLIRKETEDSASVRFSIVHEQVHVRQLQKDCRGAIKLYMADTTARNRMEVEAYCAETKERMKVSVNPEEVKRELSAILKFLYNVQDVHCI